MRMAILQKQWMLLENNINCDFLIVLSNLFEVKEDNGFFIFSGNDLNYSYEPRGIAKVLLCSVLNYMN